MACEGQVLNIHEYPKLYMLIGLKFGKEGEQQFKLPDLTKNAPRGLNYCIATEGRLLKMYSENNNY